MSFKIDRAVLHNLIVVQINKVINNQAIAPSQRFADIMSEDDLDDICNHIIKEIKSELDIDLTIHDRSIDDSLLTLIQKVFGEIHEQ